MSDPVEHKAQTTRLGSYEIVRKLARGGMAELFLARSVGPEGFEKLVVLKKILPRHATNPRYVQLFLDEAKLAASLDHPHITHAYDMGRVDGDYFFTMEYVHGQDMRSILRRTDRMDRHVPIDVAVQVARNVASALHYAHDRQCSDGTLLGIVHRDVSPSNILVSYDGAIKLADFGVAKAASSSVRTRTGTLKGKVGYMSPEQARGLSIDRRSDVFSLGVVLWEMISLKRLFKTDNDLATIQAIIHATPPSLPELRPDTPAELDRIIRRALDKDPAARYQTAQELQRDLDELAREQKLSQSTLAVSGFLGELFEAELAAMREARASGATVTEIYLGPASPPDAATPVSQSEEFAELDDADLDEDSEPLDDDDQPSLQPAAGAIDNAADMEKTALAPPPIMIAETEQLPTVVPAADFDMQTFVQANPFAVETNAGSAPALRMPEDIPGGARPGPEHGVPTSVFVAPMTPAGGTRPPLREMTPAMPAPIVGPSVSPLATPQGFPVVPASGPYAQTPPAGLTTPSWDVMDLTSKQRKIVIASGIVLLTGVIIIIIVSALTGDGRTTTPPADDEPAETTR
ncbi:MAG TPA: protein kinase [Kofleriaceae bacterium]|nr:protein kinase [Kofleriaceae bacterium]